MAAGERAGVGVIGWNAAWVCVLVAPFIGSFVGVVITRLPAGEPFLLGRSRCDGCGRILSPIELVPLVSYAAQRGRCRGCGRPIGAFHPAVELAATAIAAIAWLVGRQPGQIALDCALGWALLALGWIDWRHMRLPDALTLPLIVAGLLATWFAEPDALADHSLAAMIGWAALAGLALAYRWLRGRDGLGGGDAKLLAAGGAWVGLSDLAEIIMAAALLTLCLALLRRRGPINAATAVPFGPGLCLAIWATRVLSG